MLSASTPSSRAMASAASTIASRLSAALAGRSRRLRGDASELMAGSLSLDTNAVRYVQCSSRTVFVIPLPDPARSPPMSATAVANATDLDLVDEQAEPPAYRWRWVVLAIVLVAEIMDLLDSTVITIAAPTVRHELGGGTSAMQWWAAGYTLAFAVFMIVGGRLGDVFGRRRVFVIGIAGFTLSSIACALAPS